MEITTDIKIEIEKKSAIHDFEIKSKERPYPLYLHATKITRLEHASKTTTGTTTSTSTTISTVVRPRTPLTTSASHLTATTTKSTEVTAEEEGEFYYETFMYEYIQRPKYDYETLVYEYFPTPSKPTPTVKSHYYLPYLFRLFSNW